MAYLGRISAVLTANTTAFRREIGDSRRELLNFARQARGTQFNLDNRALNGTLTNLQRFRAELRAIRRLQAEGVGVDLPNPRRLRDQFRLFEDLGKPLTEVKNRIEGLSNSIQTELYPELEAIQRGFQRVYRAIDEGSTTFNRSAGAIDNLRQRLIGLSRATAALADLNSLSKQLSANNSGASFFTPRAQEALQRSLALRSQAQQLPARFREGAFADLAVQAEENAERIERAAARVARAQLRIITEGENPDTLTERGRRQSELDALTRRQRGINLGFEREIASAQIQQIVSPEAVRPVDALIERAEKLAVSLRENNNIRFDPLIASVGRVIEQLNRGQVSAKRAKEAVDALAAADFSKAFAASSFAEADKTLRTDSERTIAEIRKNAADERRNVVGRAGSLRLLGPNRMRAIEDINRRETISLDREEFNRSSVGQISELKRRAEELKDPKLLQSFDSLRRLAQDVSTSIRSAFNEQDPVRAQAAVDSYKLKMAALSSEIQKYEKSVASAETASKRFEQFLSISGSKSNKLGASLTRFASDIAVTRQLAGNFPSGNIAGRNAVERQIERSLKFAERATLAQQRVADNPTLSDAERQRRRKLIDDSIVREREKNLDVLVASSGRTLSKSRAQAAMERAAKNQGSIGLGTAATVQLAAQQGLFAIDDLLSATGGLEYKLRAVGNNITQLGLLLGQSGVIPGLSATTGLMVGLGVVIGGQVVSALLRYVTQAQEAEDASKALGKAVERTSTAISQISQEYSQLGNRLAGNGFSSAARSANDFADALQKIADLQRRLTEEQLLLADPVALAARARQERLAAGAEATGTPGSVIAFQRLRAENTRIEQGRAEELIAAGAPAGEDVRSSITRLAASLRRTQASLTGIRGTADAIASGNLQAGALLGFRQSGTVLTATATQAEALAAGLPTGRTESDISAQAAAIDELIERLKGVATQRVFGFETTAAKEASRAIADLSSQLVRLQGDGALIGYLKDLESASKSLSEAQSLAASAIEASMPEAVGVRASANALSDEIKKSQDRIRKANEQLERLGPGRSDEDVRRRNRVVEEERTRIRRAREGREAVLLEARRIEADRIVDPQRLFDARRSRAEANLQDAGLEGGATARRIRELEARRSQVRSELESRPDNVLVQRQAARDLDAINREMAAIEATTMALRRFTEAISRAEQEARSNLDSARQREEDVRRQSLAPAGLATQADRRQAERDLEEQRQANQRVEDAASRARLRIEREANDPNNPLAATFARLREIEELAQGGQLTDGLIEERRRLQRQVDAAVQQDAAVVAARDDSTRIEERQTSAQRGRDLLLRPGQRAARELNQQIADATEASRARLAAELEERGAPKAAAGIRDAADVEAQMQETIDKYNKKIEEGRARGLDTTATEGSRDAVAAELQTLQEARKRLLVDQMRNAAPGLFSLADSVQNAMLQGPSRAALQATDVSTVEGSRELTRLLRGDDAARDQANLVELQREANRLLDIIANAPAPVAN